MDALRVLVADDERPARIKVARLLEKDARFQWVGEAAHGYGALDQIEALAPDVLFLDVQMPGLNGFEVLEALGPAERTPVAVFSTAFEQHALAAFEAHAVDYLLKPYASDRFQRALDKAHTQSVGERQNHTPLIRALSPEARERVLVRLVGAGWTSLCLSEITVAVAARRYTKLICAGRELLVNRPFHDLAEHLGDRFVRVHRSELVQLDKVAQVQPWTHGDLIVVLEDGSTRVLTRTYRTAFLERWEARHSIRP
jgi:two-component system, LytTR family, response regulator